jgi:hypothetical protein
MTATRRNPPLWVFSDGQPLLWTLGARVSRGLEVVPSQASFRTPYSKFDRSKIRLNSFINIQMGADPSTITPRFSGFVVTPPAEHWPGIITVQCKGMLYMAERFIPRTPVNLAGMTDEEAVTTILTTSGVPSSSMSIAGSGREFGLTVTGDQHQFIWQDISGLEMIRRYDEITPYKTYDTAGGTIVRRLFSKTPGATATFQYRRGTTNELVEGATDPNVQERSTRVRVVGWNDVSSEAAATDAGTASGSFLSFRSPMIEYQNASGSGQSTAEWSVALLADNDYYFMRGWVLSRENRVVNAGDTIYVEAENLFVNQNAFASQIDDEVNDRGGLTHRITWTSQLGLGSYNPQIQDRETGEEIDPPIPPVLPPPDPGGGSTDIIADFQVLVIDKERVIISGAATDMYVVSALDTSQVLQGTITGRTWAATGVQSGMPTSGTEAYFTTAFPSLTAGSITLTVTTAFGSGTITKQLSELAGVPVRSRKLYVAGGPVLEAWTGSQWNTYTLPSGTCTIVANGPAWAVADTVYWSADDLATAPSTTIVAAGVNITCLWIEPDVNQNLVAAGLADGRVAFSTDAGDTFVIKDGPDSNPPAKIVISRDVAGLAILANSAGLWATDTYGDGWREVRTPADLEDLDLNEFRNWAVEEVSGSGVMVAAEDGTQQTGTSGDDVVAVTSHIRNDRGYALAADGSTYYVATDAATALTAGAALPGGTTAKGSTSIYRDGTAPELIYIAADDLYKTVDGFRTSGAYLLLRQSGVDGAAAGYDAAQIGVGLLAEPGPTIPPPPPSAGQYIYAMTSRSLWSYEPDSDTWTRLLGPLSANTTGTRVAARPGTATVLAKFPDTAFISTFLQRSTDGGATWTDISADLPSGVTASLIRELHYQGSTLYLYAVSAGAQGLYSSADDGDTWTLIGPQILSSQTSGPFWPHASYLAYYDASSSPVNKVSNLTRSSIQTVSALGSTAPTAFRGAEDAATYVFTDPVGALGSGLLARVTTASAAAIDVSPSGYTVSGNWRAFGFAAGPSGLVVARLQNISTGTSSTKFVRSIDNGATWTEITGLPVIASEAALSSVLTGSRSMKARPGNQLQIAALVGPSFSRLLSSLDGGQTWTEHGFTQDSGVNGWNDLALN